MSSSFPLEQSLIFFWGGEGLGGHEVKGMTANFQTNMEVIISS